MKDIQIENPQVAAVFNNYPEEMREKLMFLRQLIFDTAAATEGVGELEETLKWGEPSYLTPKSKSGSTIRIAWKESQKEEYSIFFKCTANLVPAFKEKFPKKLKFGGNRSIDVNLNDHVPEKLIIWPRNISKLIKALETSLGLANNAEEQTVRNSWASR